MIGSLIVSLHASRFSGWARSAALLAQIIFAEARLVALVVDELAYAFLAAFIVEAVGGLLGADQIILGILIGHLADPADCILGRLQRHGILLQEHLGDLGYSRLQPGKWHRFIDQAP